MAAPNLSVADATNVLEPLGISNIELVDSGGQKQVFSGLRDSREAYKFLFAPETDSEDSDMSSFYRVKRELDIMNEVECPSLVRPGSLGLTEVFINGTKYLVYSEEWVGGCSLKSHLQNGSLPISEVISLGINVAEAIKALWNNSKVHRDIKPGNIMKRTNGSFVLLDAGFALDLDAEFLTQPGYIVGTHWYYSPEQIDVRKKSKLDFRSDLFTLGIVLYEAVTQTHPFYKRDANSREMLVSILLNQPKPVSDYRSDIPDELEEIISRLLAKEPHLRYRSCDQLISALHDVPQIQGGL